ncbi:uncharacterized protein LOC127149773 [Cucumis melo]|uniref:Uncharacterized protein LOC127149773 n=1 Tax=Cucumis melo TaxID=3656 RepID=A0ABM3KUZ6_CUCME|nr:uncharacterized protein LOC127149773 [Cucumis melo]
MVVKSRVLRSAANGELHSPVTPEEKPKRSKVAAPGGKSAKAAAPEGDAEQPSPSPMRRTSARIIKLKAEKELLVRQRVELLDEPGSRSKRKKTNSQVKSKRNTPNVKDEVREDKGEVVEDKAVVVPVSKDVTKFEDGDASKPMEVCAPEKRTGDDAGPGNMVEKSDHVKVKETLRLFNKYYLHFVQEEEKRCKKAEVAQKAPKQSKSKKKAPVEDTKNKSKRPDLKAISKASCNCTHEPQASSM